MRRLDMYKYHKYAVRLYMFRIWRSMRDVFAIKQTGSGTNRGSVLAWESVIDDNNDITLWFRIQEHGSTLINLPSCFALSLS